MSYAAALKTGYSLPAKYGWYLAGWAFLCTRFDTPQAGALWFRLCVCWSDPSQRERTAMLVLQQLLVW